MLDCLINGEIGEHVSVQDRALHYGDGLFETILVRQGQPLFWQRHIDRLKLGCETLGINPVPQNILLLEAQTVCAGKPDCVVKIILSRGQSGRGYQPEWNAEPTRLVMCYPAPSVNAETHSAIRARICDLRLGIQPALSGIKHLNRLEQILARSEWSEQGIEEGILMDQEDHIISGVYGNIFLVAGDRLLTPRLDRCGIRGVMRSAVLQAFSTRCEQRRIKLDMLPEADEVFICNSVRGIRPVYRIDHWEYQIGPVSQEIQQWFHDQ